MSSTVRQLGFLSKTQTHAFAVSTGLVATIPVGHWGATQNKARWLSAGAIMSGAGFLLFSAPYFLTPTYQPFDTSAFLNGTVPISSLDSAQVCSDKGEHDRFGS